MTDLGTTADGTPILPEEVYDVADWGDLPPREPMLSELTDEELAAAQKIADQLAGAPEAPA